jgi:hypothetical protein
MKFTWLHCSCDAIHSNLLFASFHPDHRGGLTSRLRL